MASPTSCFLANRNKPGAASAATDQSVKNESLAEHTYMSLSTQQQSLETSTAVYQGTESSGFTVSGKNLISNVMSHNRGQLLFFYVFRLEIYLMTIVSFISFLRILDKDDLTTTYCNFS